MKKTFNFILLILVMLGAIYFVSKLSKQSPISNSNLGTITKAEDTFTSTSSSSGNSKPSQDLNIPKVERIPTRYACVGEYCDGSMSGESEKYTVIKLPFIKEGGEIGCGVSVFYSLDTVPKTTAVLEATYKRLFDIKMWPEIKEDGFHNTVASFNYLYFDKATLQDGLVKVYLLGQVTSPGTCADPEFKAQIEAVAFQFPNVSKIEVYLNNKLFDWCLLDVSDGEGGCNKSPKYWITEK